MQISDANGLLYYSKLEQMDIKITPTLLSAFISAIGIISKELFHEDVASMTFGTGDSLHKMVIISKDMFQSQKKIFFVFFTHKSESIHLLREISTTIFIEAKDLFRESTIEMEQLNFSINNIIDTKFSCMIACT